MSIASTSLNNSDVQGIYYSSVQIDYEKIEVDPIERMVPVLGTEPTGPLVEVVEDLKKRKLPYKLLPLDVEGKDEEEIKAALVPLKIHYLMQILFVRERTRRRVIENEEFTSRSNINVGYQYTTPLRSKLLAYWTTKFLREQEAAYTGESMPSSIASSPQNSTHQRHETPHASSPVAHKPTATHRTKKPVARDEDELKRTVANFEKTLNRLLDSTQGPEHPLAAAGTQASHVAPLNLPAVNSTPLMVRTRTAAPGDVHLESKTDSDADADEL